MALAKFRCCKCNELKDLSEIGGYQNEGKYKLSPICKECWKKILDKKDEKKENI